MLTEEFYLDNERFTFKNYSEEKISLPVYQEKNNKREKFNLVFSKKDNLVPPLWPADVRGSLLEDKNKKRLIILQVTYKNDGLQNIGNDGITIINPEKIQGGWQEANQWLSEHYLTKESCQFVKKLDCSQKLLTGCLNLSNFPSLKEVNCSQNYLTQLVIPKQVKNVNASFNNIASLSGLEVNWETINLNLNNNPLNTTEIIATVKSLHQNTKLDRVEIEKLRKQLEVSKQNLQTTKDNHKNNIQILKKEHRDQITAAQETIQELDKKLTEKEKELLETEKKKNETIYISSDSNLEKWWKKAKTPVICGVVVLVIGVIGYFCCRKFFKF